MAPRGRIARQRRELGAELRGGLLVDALEEARQGAQAPRGRIGEDWTEEEIANEVASWPPSD